MSSPSSSVTAPTFTPEAVARAHDKIKKFINRTPLLDCDALSQIASQPRDGAEQTPPQLNLYFKCENLQRTGAFKARGAFYALAQLVRSHGLERVRQRGVITVSSGNHAQGLALAAATAGVPAVIVMPRSSAQSKITGVARTLGVTRFGPDGGRGDKGRIVFCGSSNQHKKSAGDAAARQTGGFVVPPYDHADVILGQGTCAKELDEQFADLFLPRAGQLDAVVAPIGGGGLLGGIATWFGDSPEVKVFGAEPSYQGADDARRGLQQGVRIEHVMSATIADGLRTPVGVLNWEIVSDKSKVEGVFSVGENEIKMAMKLLLEHLKIVVEPSGCVPLAAVLFNLEFRRALARQQPRDGPLNLAIVLSGGNTTANSIIGLLGSLEEPQSRM